MHQPGIGGLIRHARQARGWTQEELGRRIGYTKTRISRAETGTQPIRDVSVLRQLAAALGVSPSVLGLADQAPTLMSNLDMKPLEDPVDRRAFLGTAAVLGMSTPFTTTAIAAAEPDPAALLEKRISAALFNTSNNAAPLAVGELRKRLAAAQAAFDGCRYLWLADAFPGLIASAEATLADTASPEAAALTSASYQLAGHALAKLLVSGLQPMAADRAVTRAQQSGNPLVLAQAQRTFSTAARRIGDYDQAEQIGVRAVEELPLTDNSPTELWRHASELWCVAGYAAAVRGDRDRSVECYAEAATVARQIDDSEQVRQVADYALAHQISSAYKLGDPATALDRARQVRVEALPTPERKGRFLVDLALAWQQHGRDERAYQALVVAEQHAPGEVRTRSSARNLIKTLAISPHQAVMPDLIRLAGRAHISL